MTTKNIWTDIRQFQEAAGQNLNKVPRFPDGSIRLSFGLSLIAIKSAINAFDNRFSANSERELRIKLLLEEIAEYLDAEVNDDLVETADALTDIHYIAGGTENSYGFDGQAHFDEVQGSNMSKAVNGVMEKNSDGKVIKPEGYYKPNLRQFL